ncbi:hypothetical protein SAMN04488564_102164 [Lentzea waywayandensis]|uniref:Uncharacterized protein n=1 Tax=Lentzea waywayandensis TaxID=84724 RepID=A0A1I6DB85_9PSEU|nr:hypothetical protein SAMN04488564_102164 [Lentzea waywayandensis]
MVNSLIDWCRPGGDLTPADLADTMIAVALDGPRGRGA